MAHRRTYPQRQIHKKRIKVPRNQGKLDRLDSLENLGNLENLVLSFKGGDCFFELLVLFLENLHFVLQAIDGLLLVGAIA